MIEDCSLTKWIPTVMFIIFLGTGIYCYNYVRTEDDKLIAAGIQYGGADIYVAMAVSLLSVICIVTFLTAAIISYYVTSTCSSDKFITIIPTILIVVGSVLATMIPPHK